MNIPQDIDFLAGASDIGYGVHEPFLEELLATLPRAVIGEAINAELPEKRKFSIHVEQDGVQRIDFEYGGSWCSLNGRVVWTEDGFRLSLDPPMLSLPVGRM